MFIAHLPAGYLLARATRGRLVAAPLLLGSICPDFDLALIWLDLLHTNHHHFLTHRPALWITVLALSVSLGSRWGTALGIGALLHLSLDSLAGQINWLWPIGDLTLGLVEVAAQPGWWGLSFIRHWVFGLEIIICTAALITALHRPTPKSPRRDVRAGGFSNS